MENEDNSTLEINRWLNWLKKAAYIGIFAFGLTLLVYAIKFRAFSDGVNAISNIPDDWSAFGSLLSGSSSILGAIGTVGVMLLGIKQFQIQQQQIKKQEERQDSLEKEQSKIWELQSNLLEQQLQEIYFEKFKSNLKSIEEIANKKYEFKKSLLLYNNLKTKDGKQYINEYLTETINDFNNKLATCPKDSIITPKVKLDDITWLFKKLNSVLNFSYTSEPITGDIFYFDENIGINIISTECSINHLNELLLAFQTILCLKNTLPSISTNFTIEENDIKNVINKNSNYLDLKISGTFNGYETLLMLYLEIKSLPLKHNITELFSFNVSMNGIEEFRKTDYGKNFIKKTRSIIDKSELNDSLSQKLNQMINDFNSQY